MNEEQEDDVLEAIKSKQCFGSYGSLDECLDLCGLMGLCKLESEMSKHGK